MVSISHLPLIPLNSCCISPSIRQERAENYVNASAPYPASMHPFNDTEPAEDLEIGKGKGGMARSTTVRSNTSSKNFRNLSNRKSTRRKYCPKLCGNLFRCCMKCCCTGCCPFCSDTYESDTVSDLSNVTEPSSGKLNENSVVVIVQS